MLQSLAPSIWITILLLPFSLACSLVLPIPPRVVSLSSLVFSKRKERERKREREAHERYSLPISRCGPLARARPRVARAKRRSASWSAFFYTPDDSRRLDLFCYYERGFDFCKFVEAGFFLLFFFLFLTNDIRAK